MAKKIESVTPYLAAGVVTVWILPIPSGFMEFRLFDASMFLFYFFASTLVFTKRVKSRAITDIGFPFFLFLVFNLASFLLFALPEISVFDSNQLSLHSDLLIVGLGGAFLFFFLLTRLLDTPDFTKLLRVLTDAISLLTLYLLLVHVFGYESLYLTATLTENQYQIIGWSTRNPFGFLLSLMFPFVYASFCQRRTLWGAVKCLIFLSAITYLLSRMALGGTLLAIAVLNLFPSGERKRFILPSVALLLVALAGSLMLRAGPQDYLDWRREATLASGGQPSVEMKWLNLTGSRGRYLREGFQGFFEKPIWGHGLGSFSRENPDLRSNGEVLRYPQTHNDYIQVLYELGLVGFVSFLWVFVYAFRKLLAVRDSVPDEYRWVWNGQFASLAVLAASLLLINAYETVPFWFALAGSTILATSIRRREDSLSR